jgi:hypothetical protein
MRAARSFAAVDSHTEGMPTRVITGGVPLLPGDTMLERKLHFEEHLDDAAAADERAARACRAGAGIVGTARRGGPVTGRTPNGRGPAGMWGCPPPHPPLLPPPGRSS